MKNITGDEKNRLCIFYLKVHISYLKEDLGKVCRKIERERKCKFHSMYLL
jgi:hypothetical protein